MMQPLTQQNQSCPERQPAPQPPAFEQLLQVSPQPTHGQIVEQTQGHESASASEEPLRASARPSAAWPAKMMNPRRVRGLDASLLARDVVRSVTEILH